MNLHEQKMHLRNEIKQRRKALPTSTRKEKSRQIYQFLQSLDVFKQAMSLFCYISYLSEVETQPLISSCLEQNLRLAVPKIVGKTEMLAISLNELADLEPDKMGILTPKSNDIALSPFDIAITPGLGFTEQGDRLGYGRGYYDRWFSKNKVATKIGLAFELQVVDELPLEKTDMPLDILITEERIIDLRK